MVRNNQPEKQMKLACVIPLLLLSLVNNPLQVQAQVAQPITNRSASTQNNLSELKFPRNGAPIGRRQGGARRNGCPNLNQPLTALVPGEETPEESKSFLALTVSEYPTFWVYLPQLPTNLRSGEFIFQDESGKDIYRTLVSLPQQAGIIGINLPSNPQYALKTNSKYQWYFKIYCGESQNTSDYFYVKAWVQRVPFNTSLESQLKTVKPGKYKVYAVNYLWQDAVTNLAQLRSTNSDSRVLAEDWAKLLEAVNLEEFAGASIVGHYNLQR